MEEDNNSVRSRRSYDTKDNAPKSEPVRRTDAADADTLLSDFEVIRLAWNDLGLGQIGAIDPMTARGASLANRLQKYGIDRVLEAIDAVKASAFLRGDNDKGWRASFDWLIQEDHLVRASEGGYADYKAMPKPEVYRGPTQEDIDRMQKYIDFFSGGCGNAQSHCPDGETYP